MGKRRDRERPEEAAGPRPAVEAAVRRLRALPAAAAEDAADADASVLAAAPAGPAAVGRALLATAEAELRRAWERGWQPADVVRLARRDATGPGLRFVLAAVAAEARRYPPGTLPPRWAGQLRDLDAVVWWPDDDAFLDGFARRERLSRFETVAAALLALRLVASLPHIGLAGPLPGTAGSRPSTPGGRAAAVEPKTLARIRALLAKAESTDFPDEAEAFSAKAQELMARHSLDDALLAAAAAADASAADGPDVCRLGVEGPYESAKALLLSAVAEANHCHAVWSGEYGFSTVVGFEADLELVELMYTSLLVQADAAMIRAADAHHRGTNGHGPNERGARARSGRRTRDFRESFLIAYAARIGDRLSAAARDATEHAARPEALPVLAARDVAVGETAGRLFPETTSHRLRGRDAEGWARGTEAADAARLGRRRPAG
ncbi:DUF2786 domain-containing protein [Streptomyces mobaraensis NBRC 13819 = DSM 40847]|uniref:Uncharacterized protein n=1 Tax=Streptomyces mobaraensis (strain ATCC 29032 / DSM 40847 / JCM 4168 / NBRC 13819 / NCIMB 11159 / IPCR 16-22) TaxID=1223523 RepID=M3AY20_STRM1|nr:DUF2786 domain-containing protein [Streptomyces mobaraensis]EME98517.1 hypothetical protein H340_21061 [Streptomyces mobaraensis NBRC 13819 = DSM 40847]QTT75418.1 DUF2786 domain-containing protein [Streptomyces mobaraensis NBRC 13819 = DSM 40847]